MPDSLKALSLVPLIIGGAIALMILSYMIVPILVVCFVALVVYTFLKVSQEIEEDEKNSKKDIK